MQRSVEALLEAFPYSICQGVGGLPFLGIRTFLHRKWRSLLCAFLQQYMQLLYYCWNNLKTNSLSVHNFQKFLKCCNNPICSVSIGEHDTIEKVMLLQFLHVIFKLIENFGMWTEKKHLVMLDTEGERQRTVCQNLNLVCDGQFRSWSVCFEGLLVLASVYQQ